MFEKTKIAAATLLTSALTVTSIAANAGHRISIDSWDLKSGDRKEILSNESYDISYFRDDSKKDCTRLIKWQLKEPGQSSASTYSYRDDTSINENRQGTYELSAVTEGYDSRYYFWFFGRKIYMNLPGTCNNKSEGRRTTTVKLDLNGDLYTDTKYPIMIVPGVLGYDEIELLGAEYFYGVGNAIMETSNQHTIDVSLDPWLKTEDRGLQLALKVIKYFAHGEPGSEAGKVNLLAHSHGSTTSRMAARILADIDPGRVASLTTVAGPHYGTPTADGAQWIIENWNDRNRTFWGDGKTFIQTVMFGLGDFATLALNLTTGTGIVPNFYSTAGIYDVVEDFTQRGMARFNTCYPSQGVPTDGSYFLEDNFPGKANKVVLGVNKNTSNGTADLTINDCWANPFGTSVKSERATVALARTPDDAYGNDTTFPRYSSSAEGVFGDGKGNEVDSRNPNAIRYFSLTGAGEWNTSFDVANPVVALFHAAHQLVGARTDEYDWEKWRNGYAGNLLDNIFSVTPTPRGGLLGEPGTGYLGDSDAFIPVDSTRFGQYVGTFGPWNHVDEQNGLLGLVNKGLGADDPIEVYRQHANRLKLSGL